MPWTDPKPVSDDPRSSDLVNAILNSPEHREADQDTDFLGSGAARGVRLQLDFQKCESLLQLHDIQHSIVLFGSTRIAEHRAAARAVKALEAASASAAADPVHSQRLQLLNPPSPPSGADVVVMESTYGDRDHRSMDSSIDEFLAAITHTAARGGNVVIPTFALERAQELLFVLREAQMSGKLPASLAVFLDSPMAISATQIYRRHPDDLKPKLAAQLAQGHDPFSLPNLHSVEEASESIALNVIRSGAIIMAGSGMCTGGRVRHHLRHNLGHADCSIIFVGFAAKGTLARIIIDGAKVVKLFGDMVPVRAQIHTINGFSAHAGRSDLIDWHRQTGKPEVTFLVHGEAEAQAALASGLGKSSVELPALHQHYDL